MPLPMKKSCCCDIPGCILGEDNFNRANANPPTGNWKEISGEFEILSNTLNTITPGKLATTICHPAIYDHGSWIARMTLVDVRTRAIFSVGAGDPNSSSLKVDFEPIDMDTPNSKIRVTVHGDDIVVEEYPWIASANTVNVWVCYQPTVALRGFVLGSGVPVYSCIEGDGSPCYTHGGDDVGGFFFIEGRFDDWVYEVTNIDNIECPNCGCLCLIPTSQLNPDVGCFPEQLCVSFVNVGESECILPDFDVVLTKLTTGNQWRSGPVDLCTRQFELEANCTQQIEPDGTTWWTMSLRMTNTYSEPIFMVYWTNVDGSRGETLTIKFPVYEESSCSPLNLVYKYATLYTTGTSGGPGCWTNICCPSWCGSNDVRWEVTITECPTSSNNLFFLSPNEGGNPQAINLQFELGS